MADIIAAVIAIVAAIGGAFIGQLWGRHKGEMDGRNSALRDVERAQGQAYRQARERADAAPVHSDATDARDFLRSRRDGDK